MKNFKDALLLYAVTDRSWTEDSTLASQVEAAIKGGATCVQLREKDMGYAEFLNEAKEIRTLCRRYGVPFIINDNVDVAVAVEADGVHVGQGDMDAVKTRQMIGADKILGVSAENVEQAVAAVRNGADYVGVGAVFPTETKTDANYVPYETLRAICDTVEVPIVAIGGINKHNINTLKGSGIDGVALVSAIFAAKDIETACRELKKLAEEIIG